MTGFEVRLDKVVTWALAREGGSPIRLPSAGPRSDESRGAVNSLLSYQVETGTRQARARERVTGGSPVGERATREENFLHAKRGAPDSLFALALPPAPRLGSSSKFR